MELLKDYSTIINVNVETYNKPGLLNLFVPKGAQLRSPITMDKITKTDIGLSYTDAPPDELKTDELNKIHYKEKEITLYNEETKVRMTFKNENGFTVKELFDHVVAFENKSRPLTDWFGGIDAHHIFFEGLEWSPKEKAFIVIWGS